MKNWFWILAVLAVVGVLGWFWYDASKPLPGEQLADLGREHVAVGTKVDYNSNPPTSGSHYADWIRKGIYDQPKEDGYLIHSLEHGYIIISYNCEVHEQSLRLVSSALAHKEEEATGSGESTGSADISGEDWKLPECADLVDKLNDIYKKKGQDRLIVIPRPNLETRIALTAWTRVDKFNPSTSSGLSGQDEKRVNNFIDAFRNKGPEKTME